MKDRTSGSGDERYASGRFAPAPDDERAPEEAAGRRLPGEGGPEWPPGEPGEGMPPGNAGRTPREGTSGRLAGEGASGRMPGSTGPGREGLTADDRIPRDGLADDRVSDDRLMDDRIARDGLEADDRMQRGGPTADDRMPRDGLTAGDRMPADATQPPAPPGPAGMPVSGDAAGPGSGTHGRPHGSEGLRPGTEDLGVDTPPAPGRGAGTYEERRMPDDGLGAAYAGEGTEYAAGGGRGDYAAGGGRGEYAAGGGRGEYAAGGGRGDYEAGGGRGDYAAAGGTAAPGTGAVSAAGTGTGAATSGAGAPLLPHDEADQWEQRMRQVVAGFVDEPRGAVEEADRALEELTARFTEAVTRRRHTLRRSWEGAEENGPGTDTDTEQLRLALRDYRELAGHLLQG
ncbi:hypothetical protein ACGFT2_29935 [Streptomyces sp. NPDC048514]|uniref:hypothetical protein n=1 Tax=Streptomyces sp. NPDC048514 TaxID=3365564 RepID=UPI003719520E